MSITTLPKDVIGHLLTFFSYHDWATLQRTSKLFHHEKHNILRKNAKPYMTKEKHKQKRDHLSLETSFYSYLGTPINITPENLDKEINRVFSSLPEGSLVHGPTVLRYLLGYEFREMHISSHSQNFREILESLKLKVRKIVLSLDNSTDVFTLRIDCEDGYTVFISDWTQPFSYYPRKQRLVVSDYGIYTLVTGLWMHPLGTYKEYRDLSRYRLRVSNRSASSSSRTLFPYISCEHQYLIPDERGVVRSGTEFVFDAKDVNNKKRKKGKFPKKRLLILSSFQGYQVDLITRQVYNPETNAISGKITKKGVFKKRCIQQPFGDTEYEALVPTTCEDEECNHPFQYREYKKGICLNLGRSISRKKLIYVMYSIEETIQQFEKWSGTLLRQRRPADESMEVKTMLSVEKFRRFMLQCDEIRAEELYQRLEGKQKKYPVGEFIKFCDEFTVTENNFEEWLRNFEALGGYIWFGNRDIRKAAWGEREEEFSEEEDGKTISRMARDICHWREKMEKRRSSVPWKKGSITTEKLIKFEFDEETLLNDLDFDDLINIVGREFFPTSTIKKEAKERLRKRRRELEKEFDHVFFDGCEPEDGDEHHNEPSWDVD